MESKRKASGANGLETAADTDRAAKRRKLIEEYGDLTDGETTKSTTAYGINILESIRATVDKNGRSVSPYFESLPSRSANAQYYKKIRLPLSLELIERKLKEHQYPTLSSLESDFKRLVSNAKETNDRNSTIFGDAERVRKAVSNLMVKYNPAYKSGNYQAVPTPLPPTPEPEDEDEEREGEGDEDMDSQGGGDDEADAIPQGDTDDAELDDADEDEPEREEDSDAELEDDDENEAEERDDDDSTQPRRRRGSSWKKADPTPARNSATPAQKANSRSGKAYHSYEGVPFKGLSFQQAQEKIVDELIRKKEEADDYPYFDAFINLPPRTLRDYYEFIAEPLSLKGLQKLVRGQHGRSEATWVSDFKAWAAFEDQASLIWKNAYHYNEDGSDIFMSAQELEETFHELLREAKANVPEPPQPKIKLKLPQAAEVPGHPKKITIHVGGKNSATGSPTPVTGQSAESEATRNESSGQRNPLSGASSGGTSINLSLLEKTRSLSVSAGPSSPSIKSVSKTEDAVQTTPVVRPQATVTTTTFQHFMPVVVNAPTPLSNGTALPYQQPPPPPPPPKKSAADILEATKYRPQPITEEEALMPKLIITTHPSLQAEKQLITTFVASATEYQQDIIVNAPISHYRLQLKPQVASFLETGQREWKLNVIHDTSRLYPSSVAFDKRGESIYDVTLRYGVNRLEVTLVAALPRGEKTPNGLNMEMERFVVHYNLLRH